MDDDRDDQILEERLSGTSMRAIAKRHKCSSGDVEAAIDRRLNYELDNQMRLKAIKLDIARLEALMAPFYEQATKDRDVQAGTLCVKILERRALLLGLDSPTKVDVVQLQVEEKPSSFDRMYETIMRFKHGSDWRPGDGNGAADLPPEPGT